MRRVLLAAVLLAGLVGCQRTAAIDKEQIEAGIRAVMDAQTVAWNRGDIEGYMEGYWNSPDVLFASRGTFARGWQNLLDRYRSGYPDGHMGVLGFDHIEVHPITGDSAWVVGEWALDMEDTSPHGVFTLIFMKKADGWRIVHDHSSGAPIDAGP
jgi:ketosteroid isomerase-like protein